MGRSSSSPWDRSGRDPDRRAHGPARDRHRHLERGCWPSRAQSATERRRRARAPHRRHARARACGAGRPADPPGPRDAPLPRITKRRVGSCARVAEARAPRRALRLERVRLRLPRSPPRSVGVWRDENGDPQPFELRLRQAAGSTSSSRWRDRPTLVGRSRDEWEAAIAERGLRARGALRWFDRRPFDAESPEFVAARATAAERRPPTTAIARLYDPWSAFVHGGRRSLRRGGVGLGRPGRRAGGRDRPHRRPVAQRGRSP